MKEEIWVDIKGFEGLYQISSYGRIKSYDRYIRNGFNTYIKKGKIRKNQFSNNGYYIIIFNINTKMYQYLIHRLVASNFIPNENNYSQVNHKDGNKLNNNVENLEWITPSNNIIHSINNNLTSQWGETHKSTKLKKEDIKEIRKLGKTMSRTDISKEYGISIKAVCNIINNKTWKRVI